MSSTTLVLALFLVVQAACALPGSEYSTFITGGENVVVGEFPYQASVVLQRPRKNDEIVCGGSIVNERWILTSASCNLKPKDGEIVVKAGQLYRNGDSEYVQTKKISLIIISKDFQGGSSNRIKEYDLALLKLESPVLFNDRVKSVKLSSNNTIPTGKAQLTGFGPISTQGGLRYPNVLQKASVAIISKGSCEDAIASVSPQNNNLLTDRHICTGPLDSTITACADDLGSPLVQQTKNGTVQIGVVSWSPFPCGRRGSPTVYTRISEYYKWITERISEN